MFQNEVRANLILILINLFWLCGLFRYLPVGPAWPEVLLNRHHFSPYFFSHGPLIFWLQVKIYLLIQHILVTRDRTSILKLTIGIYFQNNLGPKPSSYLYALSSPQKTKKAEAKMHTVKHVHKSKSLLFDCLFLKSKLGRKLCLNKKQHSFCAECISEWCSVFHIQPNIFL